MRTKIILTGLVAIFLLTGISSADTLVWSGAVSSDGNRTQDIPLQAGLSYYFVASGSVYFGRWYVNGQSLYNDACYEFTAKGYPDPLPVLQNSLSVFLDTSAGYNPDHVYRSPIFLVTIPGTSIAFWIFDTDYRDNSGNVRVDLYSLDDTSHVTSGGGGGGVPASFASASQFVGNFTATDPARTYAQFHSQVVLNADGTGWIKDFINNVPIKVRYPESLSASGFSPLMWSFETATGRFVLDIACAGRYPGLGYFEAAITGDTNSFTLSGRWADGRSGSMAFSRSR